MKLSGLNLSLVSIHRKGIFDMDAMAFCCDNCGRMIVNSAVVNDEDSGKKYVIGLDCKKTLIDKKTIDKILAEDDSFSGKYKVKEFKREVGDVQKVMMYLDNSERYKVKCDQGTYQYLFVYDMTKTDMFGNVGATIFSESLGYLFKIGLKDVLQAAVNKGIIKPV